MYAKRIQIDPMREGHPEPFHTPNTIPAAWDLSDFFSPSGTPQMEVNGTAYDQVTGNVNDHPSTLSPQNPV
jgi:hypothetical protein